MKTTLSFGKIDAENRGRKSNEITIDIELRENKKGEIEFSARGNVWNMFHSDIIMGGQCIDTIFKDYGEQIKDKGLIEEFKTIRNIWKKYHLNGMHAGTPEQEKALCESGIKFSDYTERVEYLKSVGLYEVPMEDGSMYKYGTAWLYEPLPENVIKDIERIINEGMAGLSKVALERAGYEADVALNGDVVAGHNALEKEKNLADDMDYEIEV